MTHIVQVWELRSYLLAGELSGKCLDQESSAVISKFKARISCINVIGDCEK